jgi:hypothetical protein
MKCSNCGNDIDQTAKFCPDCGTRVQPVSSAPENVQPAAWAAPSADADAGAAPPAAAQPAQTFGQAYVRADYDPMRDGRAAPGTTPVPAWQSQPKQGYAGQPAYPPQPAVSQRPSSTGMIVFAIINMVCCASGISFILGLIALIFAIMSGSEANVDESRKKLKIAKILNFVGLGFVILTIIVGIVFFALILTNNQWNDYINPEFFSDYRYQ